jgi:SAM-dependent methyltransferase
MEKDFKSINIVENIKTKYRDIKVCYSSGINIDSKTISSFGAEWTDFPTFDLEEIELLGSEYFDILTPEMVNSNTVMADFGCGSGRYSKYFQGKVAKIYCIDPSDAVFSADNMMGKDENVEIIKSSISDLPFEDNTFDFGMSIGVLHHIPNTQQAMLDCVKKIKIGGYFYTYLYYSLDNRGFGFKLIWNLSNLLRVGISALPQKMKSIVCEILAFSIYLPLILLVKGLKYISINERFWSKIPLSAYHNKSYFVIRNDALDRFGTPLEQRFSKSEIEIMMRKSGLSEIIFSEKMPFWHAVGKKIKHV